jgi:hypothetical protein
LRLKPEPRLAPQVVAQHVALAADRGNADSELSFARRGINCAQGGRFADISAGSDDEDTVGALRARKLEKLQSDSHLNPFS